MSNEKEEIINDNLLTVTTCKKLREANIHDQFYQKCLNLKNFIPFKGKAVIHFSDNSNAGIDKRYAEYLKHENCDIVAHRSSTHLLALELKEKKLLSSEIANSIRLLKN